jgi:hypothetical protein
MLLRLAYLTVTNAFAALRLLPVGDRDKDMEILALRHQITVLERQLGTDHVRARGPGLPRRPSRAAPPPVAAPTAAARATGHHLALAPRPDEPASRPHLPTQAARTPAHRPLHTRPCPAPGQGQPELGVPAGARRARHPRHQGRPLHRLGDPQGRGHRPRTPAQQHDLGRLPTLPSRNAACLRLHRDHHPDRAAPVHPRHHRARQPPYPHSRPPPRIRAQAGWRRPSGTS